MSPFPHCIEEVKKFSQPHDMEEEDYSWVSPAIGRPVAFHLLKTTWIICILGA